MITRCSLNQLKRVATFLDNHLRDSKINPRLLQAPVQLDSVACGGSTLGREEVAWALQNCINIRVGGVLAITSCHLPTNSIGQLWEH